MKLGDFDTLTFDVVGTLIDFEAGILDWFRPMLGRHGVPKTDEAILTAFAAVEDRYQRETPEKSFTEMLPLIYREMISGWGMGPREEDAEDFRDSIRSWPPFPDTVEALEELGTRYRLVAVTNADSWALGHMSANMGDPFQEKITCDEVGVNKPSPRVFEYVLDKLTPAGVKKKDVLHTAQSQYHDIAPASSLGFATMWIERRHGKGGFGATPRPEEIVTPTFHATGMADFVRQVREEQQPSGTTGL
ncbi:MAG TPA: HAD-IA family hydrolase [Rubrobacter sp.]|nr:HAD-IA family hydrolase [Rubrobacter sp.]